MVNNDTNLTVNHKPPPMCPKCGSHRTQIVGLPGDGTVVVRCNACGTRSEVKLEAETRPAAALAAGFTVSFVA